MAASGGSPEFLKALDEMRELHIRKAHDYGADEDPLANCRQCRSIGIPPWKGVVTRMLDKVQRIESFCKKGELKNESLSDAFRDLAAYAIIADILYKEETK